MTFPFRETRHNGLGSTRNLLPWSDSQCLQCVALYSIYVLWLGVSVRAGTPHKVAQVKDFINKGQNYRPPGSSEAMEKHQGQGAARLASFGDL